MGRCNRQKVPSLYPSIQFAHFSWLVLGRRLLQPSNSHNGTMNLSGRVAKHKMRMQCGPSLLRTHMRIIVITASSTKVRRLGGRLRCICVVVMTTQAGNTESWKQRAYHDQGMNMFPNVADATRPLSCRSARAYVHLHFDFNIRGTNRAPQRT